MRRYRWEISIVLLLLVCVGIVYHQSLRAGFVQWDDDILIYNNPHLTGLNARALCWMFGAFDYVVRYQPLTWLTWSVVRECAGRNPYDYHRVNLIFHGFNTGLVFILIRNLLIRSASGSFDYQRKSRAAICAGTGALVWALHPMRVEVVAWASGLLHAQALFFLLLSTLFYLRAASSPPTGRPFFYWSSVASFAASLLSYPVGLGFVVVPVALDFCILRRLPGPARVWIEKLPFVGVAALVLGITLWARFHVSGGWLPSPSLDEFNASHRFMQACYLWAYYLWKPWVPFDLSPVYTTLLAFKPSDAPFGRSLMLLLVLWTVLMTQRRRWPLGLPIWITYLIVLVPMLGLTEHPHYPNDRYSYVVGILWAIVLAAFLWSLGAKPKPFALTLGACLALAVGFGALSMRQAQVWQDSKRLFQYMIAELGQDPYRADIHRRLGEVLAAEGNLELAILHYQTALTISPEFAEAHYDLAAALEQRQELAGALTHYLAVARLLPNHAQAHACAGFILAQQGRNQEAMDHLQRALKLDPNRQEVRDKLAALLEAQVRALPSSQR